MVTGGQAGVAHLTLAELDAPARPVHDDDVLERRDIGTGRAQGLEKGHDLAATIDAVGDDDGLGSRRAQPGGDRLGAEPREQHGVDRPQPVAGVDGDERLDQVGHVDRHHVAPANAERSQARGQGGHLDGQLPIGDGPGVTRLTFPHDRRPLCGRRVLRPPVHAVVRHVDAAALEISEILDGPAAQGLPRGGPPLLICHPSPVQVRIVGIQGASHRQLLRLVGRTPLLRQGE